MTNEIFFPIFNSNFSKFMADPNCNDYEPTLGDRLERYVLSPQYQTEKDDLNVRISMFVLQTLVDIGIYIEIGVNLLAWKFISNETWIRINIACAKITQKMAEYRYGLQFESIRSGCSNGEVAFRCLQGGGFEADPGMHCYTGLKIERNDAEVPFGFDTKYRSKGYIED